jgi:hypothetical protein
MIALLGNDKTSRAYLQKVKDILKKLDERH